MRNNKLIINILLIVAGFFLGIEAMAQANQDITIPLSSGSDRGKLDVDIHLGGIKVVGVDRNDVLVRYEEMEKYSTKRMKEWEEKIGEIVENALDLDNKSKKKERSKEGLRKIGKSKVGLEIRENNNRVVIRGESTQGRSLFIYVEVPRNFDLMLETHANGNINVENIDGEIELESHTANIIAERISGSINASTYSGEIVVTFDRINDNTEMAFSNYSEDIDISFPAGYKCDFKLKTNGEILSDMDLEEYSKENSLKNVGSNGTYKVYTDTWTYARLNGGGPEIKIKSEWGDLLIRAK